MLGVLLGWLVISSPWVGWLVCGVILLAGLSLADDVSGLPVIWRFFVHFLVAGLWGWYLDLPWLLAMVAVFGMVWMTNLYNFMDGSDGLAGGMALFGFGSYAIAGWLAGDVVLALACAGISAAAAAFLIYNFHPARIFMGDAGSIPLGFSAGAIGLLGWRHGIWPLWFPGLVFSPFIVDATVTLVKRALAGEKVWQAHRNHYYQWLVRMGWGHRKTALWGYVMMLSTGGSAIWMARQSPAIQTAGLLGWVVVYLAVLHGVDRMRLTRYDQRLM